MNAVELVGVGKSYGSTVAVEEIEFAVAAGEFLTLLGPSGCGKTTTLRMVAGFVTASRGTIRLGGADVTRLPAHRRDIGLVFQSYALFPHMTVEENIAFGLKMRNCAGAEVRRRVGKALALVQLDGLGRRFPRELSGGQQQRVALARALVIRPRVLLLDEPFGALDRQLRDHMRIELRELQRRLGLPTIFVTHDQGEALSMSDRVVVMNGGRIDQIGSPGDVYERPRTPFVARFLGRSNILDMTVADTIAGGTLLRCGGLAVEAVLAAPVGTKLTVLIRPEGIAIRPLSQGGVAGVVRSVSYLGATVEHQIVVDDLTIEVASANRPGAALAKVGDSVVLDIPPEAVWVLDEQT